VPSQTVAADLGVPAQVISPGVDSARLRTGAPAPGTAEILVVGALTRRLTRGGVGYAQRDPIEAKGIGQLEAWIADPAIDVVIATGGTGVTGRDVTPEAFHGVYEKEIPGFGELFRWLSYDKIGTSTIQSRATAGVAGGTYLFALPGSPSACRDAWEGILVHQLDNRFRPCNFVELMPRLQEHIKS